MRDIINATCGSTWFTVIDLKDVYNYIEIEEFDKHKMAFEFKEKIYEWNEMTMGFKNSPMIMQKVMNRIFGDIIAKSLMIYLDDIIIFDKDIDTHMKNIETVLRRLDRHNFRVNPKKIQYCQNELTIL